MNIGNISGGTNGGWRKVKQRPSNWTCPTCGKHLKHYWVACPVDNTRRPDPEQE